MILSLVVHEGNIQDRDGAKLVLWKVKDLLVNMIKVWADSAYVGELQEWVFEKLGWFLQIVPKPPDQQGFHVLPFRWIVERTFAWLGNYRLLAKDYEYSTTNSESNIYLAMIHLMARRIAH